MQLIALTVRRLSYVDDQRNLGCLVFLIYLFARSREHGSASNPDTIVEQRALARLDVDGIEILLQQVLLVGEDDDALRLPVEAQNIEHHPGARSELLQQLSLLII